MSTPRTSVKIAALALIPSASVMTTTKANPGDLRSCRNANPRSFILVSLCGDAVFNYTAIEQMHCAIRVLRETLVMCDHANRGAALVQFSKQIHDRFAITRIEIAGRLVGQ